MVLLCLVKYNKIMRPNLPETSQKRVVIVGGGFAGITLAKKLVKTDYQVVMIDKNNYHQFQPLLYQVATGGLEPGSIAYPLRKIFPAHKNIHIRLAEVKDINTEQQQLETSIGNVNYDILVIATGAVTNFFGNKNIEMYGFGMKSVSEALDLRSIILQNFEEALLVREEAKQDVLMNIVIVGGGPTGVEVAGALSEMKRYVLPKDFPELDFTKMDIHLIESNERVLSAMTPESSDKAKKYLENMGVHVATNTRVTDYDGETVTIKDQEPLKAAVLLWAAGIKGAIPSGLNESIIVRGNRIKCNQFNQVDGFDNIYAIGDVASVQTSQTPNGHPQVAPVGMQQAVNLAKNLVYLQHNKPLVPFTYFDKGSMATVGRNKAVVEMSFIKFGGFVAWLAWMFVHLMSIVGFRNRLEILMTWTYNYFRYDQALRLIIRPFERKKKFEY